MVTILRPGTTEEQKRMLIKWFEDQGLRVTEYVNDDETVLGIVFVRVHDAVVNGTLLGSDDEDDAESEEYTQCGAVLANAPRLYAITREE